MMASRRSIHALPRVRLVALTLRSTGLIRAAGCRSEDRSILTMETKKPACGGLAWFSLLTPGAAIRLPGHSHVVRWAHCRREVSARVKWCCALQGCGTCSTRSARRPDGVAGIALE